MDVSLEHSSHAGITGGKITHKRERCDGEGLTLRAEYELVEGCVFVLPINSYATVCKVQNATLFLKLVKLCM